MGNGIVRIISGTARGRKLKEPVGFDIRPTSDMVKESVFNIIQFDIEGRRVLDLFAGTGQLGIEALSRGAESVVFVDSKPEAAKLIKENLKLCGFSEKAAVHTRDALRFLEDGSGYGAGRGQNSGAEGRPADRMRPTGAFDLIFIDPPYDTLLFGKSLQRIIKFDKLSTNGIMICETKIDSVAPAVSPPYSLQKEYRYGSVKILRYERL